MRAHTHNHTEGAAGRCNPEWAAKPLPSHCGCVSLPPEPYFLRVTVQKLNLDILKWKQGVPRRHMVEVSAVAAQWSRSLLVLTSLCCKHCNSLRKRKKKKKACHFCPISQRLLHSLTEVEPHYEDFIKLAKQTGKSSVKHRAELAKINEQSIS